MLGRLTGDSRSPFVFPLAASALFSSALTNNL